jgi:hypothetical protein
MQGLVGRRKIRDYFRPSIPDNFEHWQDFGNDAQIIRFMNNLQEFAENDVDWREEGIEYQEELRDNKIPSGLVPLEKMIYRHDMYKEKKEVSKPDDYMEIYIRSPCSSKIVKIGNGTTSKERREIEI